MVNGSVCEASTPIGLQNGTLKYLSVKCSVPRYSRESLIPGIVHLGVGGFHRSHQAVYIHELLERGLGQGWAICGVGIMPGDKAINVALRSQDCLYSLVERSGRYDSVKVIGSIAEHIFGIEQAEEVFKAISRRETKIVSLTATEVGYCFNQGSGEFDFDNAGIENDYASPSAPRTIFGYLAEGLRQRMRSSAGPVTLLSCDNLQGNGSVLKKMLLAYVSRLEPELSDWIETNVSFPNSMVDRITPATTDLERRLVASFGIQDQAPVVSEFFRQWVIEDEFIAGRPPLEEVGVQFVKDVAPFEKMKLRLLNATHSAIGYLGYLAGHRFVHEVASDPDFVPYLRRMMEVEVGPTVGDVPGINLCNYQRLVIERFSNPSIQDQTLRICIDGSGKMPRFVFPSLLDQLQLGGPIETLSLCTASWMRFVNGVDEQGKLIPLNDPMADRLKSAAQSKSAMLLLELTDIFGGLKDEKRFVTLVSEFLTSLYEKGARETLRAAVRQYT